MSVIIKIVWYWMRILPVEEGKPMSEMTARLGTMEQASFHPSKHSNSCCRVTEVCTWWERWQVPYSCVLALFQFALCVCGLGLALMDWVMERDAFIFGWPSKFSVAFRHWFGRQFISYLWMPFFRIYHTVRWKLTKPLTGSRVLVCTTTFIGLFSSRFPFPLVCTTAQHPWRVLLTRLNKFRLPIQGAK